MKNYNEEYFYMIPFGANCPRLKFSDSMTDSFLLYEKHALDESHLVKFRFGEPKPRKPKMGDVHSYAHHLVISDKIKEAMQALQLTKVQYLPASIWNSAESTQVNNYWVLHIYNLINCLDWENSVVDADEEGIVISIDRLVLDNEALDKVPLEERLVFALGEERLQILFHASIVEKIAALKPDGVKFAAVAGWSDKKLFEAAYWEYILGKDD